MSTTEIMFHNLTKVRIEGSDSEQRRFLDIELINHLGESVQITIFARPKNMTAWKELYYALRKGLNPPDELDGGLNEQFEHFSK